MKMYHSRRSCQVILETFRVSYLEPSQVPTNMYKHHNSIHDLNKLSIYIIFEFSIYINI